MKIPDDPNPRSKFLDESAALRNSLYRHQTLLVLLSDAFDLLGNRKVSDQLARVAEDLYRIADGIEVLVQDRIDSQIEAANRMHGMVVNGLLAVAGIDKPAQPEDVLDTFEGIEPGDVLECIQENSMWNLCERCTVKRRHGNGVLFTTGAGTLSPKLWRKVASAEPLTTTER